MKKPLILLSLILLTTCKKTPKPTPEKLIFQVNYVQGNVLGKDFQPLKAAGQFENEKLTTENNSIIDFQMFPAKYETKFTTYSHSNLDIEPKKVQFYSGNMLFTYGKNNSKNWTILIPQLAIIEVKGKQPGTEGKEVSFRLKSGKNSLYLKNYANSIYIRPINQELAKIVPSFEVKKGEEISFNFDEIKKIVQNIILQKKKQSNHKTDPPEKNEPKEIDWFQTAKISAKDMANAKEERENQIFISERETTGGDMTAILELKKKDKIRYIEIQSICRAQKDLFELVLKDQTIRGILLKHTATHYHIRKVIENVKLKIPVAKVESSRPNVKFKDVCK